MIKFKNKLQGNVIRKTLHDNPDFLSYPWNEISEEAKDFVKKCLYKAP